MKLKIKKVKENAKIPKYALKDDVALDLFCVEKTELKPNEIKMISTGIAMEIPRGYAGLIWDKSGLAGKYGIKTMGGVIDSGYRGEIKVVITNFSDKKYIFEEGEKVAQIIIQKVEQPEIFEVEELNESERGENNFGSTGKF